MKEKEKIQIPEDVADLVLHACTHFEGNATESVFCHSIHKFIKNSLRELEPALYNNCQKYIPSPQSLYRALGRRPPGYIRKGKGSHYLPQILDCYIRKFEQDFPKEAKRFREEKNSNVPRPIEDSNRIDPAYLTTPAPGQSSCSERPSR